MKNLQEFQLKSGTLSLERIGRLPLGVVVLLAALSNLATAADQQLHLTQRVIPVPHPITSLLRSARIHRELQLTPETIAQIEQAADEVDQPLWRLRDLPPDKRHDQVVKLINQLKRRLSESLTIRQMDRLNQIVWQAQGIEAILEPDVARQLRLSPQQNTAILAHLSDGYKRIAEVNLNPQMRSHVRSAYTRTIQTETQQNITTVLNTAQQSVLTALLGQPINLSQIRTVACKAPEIIAETWINSGPVKLSELRGKVVVVHFYAFGCGNCVRSLPYYNDWVQGLGAEDFAIVGIHRPETEREREVERVEQKATEAGMKHPIAIDNESLNWEAWGNHTWPTTYLIDKNGFVRYWWYGELNWKGNDSEKLLRDRIQELMRESADV